MKRYLLDTDVLSEPLRKSPNRYLLDRLNRESGRLATSAINWAELLYGVLRLPAGKRRRQYRAYLEEIVEPHVSILSFDDECAFWLAGRRAILSRSGRTIPVVDGMIAATAAVNELTLVTRNLRHFEGVPGLRVESWHGPA